MRSHTRQQQRRLLLFLLAALGVLVLASHHRASGAARAEPRPAPPPGPRLQQSAQDLATLSVDVWSLPPRPRAESKVAAHLNRTELAGLQALCGRCLYHSLYKVVIGHHFGSRVFVATGDIAEMWLRDSSVQLGGLLPRIAAHPGFRGLVEGAIRVQAFFITQDPYANAFRMRWRPVSQHPKHERLIGRGGWVGTRNYELDSGAYFIHLLWDYYRTPGLYAPEQLLAQAAVFDAVMLMVDTWVVEQRHEERSPYRYSELERGGLGSPVGYTGMTWSGFRPSDDASVYGYNVPANMHAAGALERALQLNARIWHSERLAERAGALLRDIRQGIERHGIVEAAPGVRVYAYEVDGLGQSLVDMDDPNLPSLLSIPLLGYSGFDPAVYAATRERILSKNNSLYFEGSQFRGLGSTHTPEGFVWPLGLAAEALTSRNPAEQARLLRQLLSMQCGNGLMHESVDSSDPQQCTRPWFGWANALLVTLVEQLLGLDCEAAAEAQRLEAVKAVEKRDAGAQPANGGPEDPRYYANLEAHIQHDLEEVPLGKSEDELWAEGLLSRAAGDLAASVEAAGELGGAARGAAAGATAAGGWARGAAAQAGAEESRDGLEARRRS